MLKLKDLAARADFQLGDLHVSPGRRRVIGPGGSWHVEPQYMQVFLRLLDSAATVVTRADLFDECWGGAAVGDDSLNRAVRGARQIGERVGSAAFAIETIPRTGYRLQLARGVEIAPSSSSRKDRGSRRHDAVEKAYDAWRMGEPCADVEAIAALDHVLSQASDDAPAWGMSALLHRKAAEYATGDQCAGHVSACERAARRALSIDPRQSDAHVALANVLPLYGRWTEVRRQLDSIRASDGEHVPAAHDLAILEMATGRVRSAGVVIARLIDRDPLAATFYYKRIYHLWSFGELGEMDRVATRALQLWPRHPAIWNARLWTLLFTNRAAQAQALLNDPDRPFLPAAALALLSITCAAVASRQAGEERGERREQAVAEAVAASSRGPAQAVAALLSLLALDAIDEAFTVANGYYLGLGATAAPQRWNTGDPSITDQHRRVTQPLFIPAARSMRADPRFLDLCAGIGLMDYWQHSGLSPDFLGAASSSGL